MTDDSVMASLSKGSVKPQVSQINKNAECWNDDSFQNGDFHESKTKTGNRKQKENRRGRDLNSQSTREHAFRLFRKKAAKNRLANFAFSSKMVFIQKPERVFETVSFDPTFSKSWNSRRAHYQIARNAGKSRTKRRSRLYATSA